MINISNLHKVFPAASKDASPVAALRGLSLDIERGRVAGIIGPSGSGKSTLGRCLTLLERPTEGSIRVGGQELTTLNGAELREARRRISVVFQAFNLLDSRTALGNVELPLQLRGVGAKERRALASEALERVGLAEKAKVHPAHLSGGQQQRVAIARALVTKPDVLVSDEATSALDPTTTRSIIALIAQLTDELSLTTLLITHQHEVVAEVCDEVYTLEDGLVTDRQVLRERHPVGVVSARREFRSPGLAAASAEPHRVVATRAQEVLA